MAAEAIGLDAELAGQPASWADGAQGKGAKSGLQEPSPTVVRFSAGATKGFRAGRDFPGRVMHSPEGGEGRSPRGQLSQKATAVHLPHVPAPSPVLLPMSSFPPFPSTL